MQKNWQPECIIHLQSNIRKTYQFRGQFKLFEQRKYKWLIFEFLSQFYCVCSNHNLQNRYLFWIFVRWQAIINFWLDICVFFASAWLLRFFWNWYWFSINWEIPFRWHYFRVAYSQICIVLLFPHAIIIEVEQTIDVHRKPFFVIRRFEWFAIFERIWYFQWIWMFDWNGSTPNALFHDFWMVHVHDVYLR